MDFTENTIPVLLFSYCLLGICCLAVGSVYRVLTYQLVYMLQYYLCNIVGLFWFLTCWRVVHIQKLVQCIKPEDFTATNCVKPSGNQMCHWVVKVQTYGHSATNVMHGWHKLMLSPKHIDFLLCTDAEDCFHNMHLSDSSKIWFLR
jgi:hypothetical protein